MAITPQTLAADTFARLVLEKGLPVVGPFKDGYKYAIEKRQTDAVLYRTPCVDWDNIPVTQVASADPAAGAASVTPIGTIASGTQYRILMATQTYVRDANAANVYMRMAISDGTRYIAHFAPTTALTANQTVIVVWGIDMPDMTWTDGATVYITTAIPKNLILPSGYSMVVFFDNKQATDNGGPVYLQVQAAPQ